MVSRTIWKSTLVSFQSLQIALVLQTRTDRL
jgi:hypothetical protein